MVNMLKETAGPPRVLDVAPRVSGMRAAVSHVNGRYAVCRVRGSTNHDAALVADRLPDLRAVWFHVSLMMNAFFPCRLR